MQKSVRSNIAGGVVIGNGGKVVVVNQNGNSWSLPKGHIEKGESALAAAKREIEEEAGITRLKPIKRLGEYQRFKTSLSGGDDRSELKSIDMFLFTTEQSDLQPSDPANPEARWVETDNVSRLLTHKKDRAFFEKILPELQSFREPH